MSTKPVRPSERVKATHDERGMTLRHRHEHERHQADDSTALRVDPVDMGNQIAITIPGETVTLSRPAARYLAYKLLAIDSECGMRDEYFAEGEACKKEDR